ncbi:MAG: rhomboid family intramembrane serine protease [Desulfuromonadales bacterium]|nr:rhomboid family intramembrane serine protease [Desulfuromonadales bacterium]
MSMLKVGEIYDRVESYFDRHSEQLFILKAVVLVMVLKLLEDILYLWWFTILLLAPLFVFLLLRIMSVHQGKNMLQVIRENLTLIPAPYLDRDEKSPVLPCVTYLLILANVLVFYTVMPFLEEDTLWNLFFVPQDLYFINTLVAQVANIFLHADGWHLWGNMAFLWAMGTVLEKRIGPGWLFGLYMATGCASNLLFLFADFLVTGFLSPSLGASGAISGLMGVYAVRCYFKTMVFPFPIFGLFSFFLPLHLKVRMNALVVVGLFFWADLSSGIDQALGVISSNVGYAAHLGGMIVGALLAYGINLSDQALQEKRLFTARQAFGGQEWLGDDVGEKAIREYLQQDEANPEALILLARKLSQYSTSEEGRELYQKAIDLQIKTNITEALSYYREYFNKYLRPLRQDLQVRMAVIAEKEGDDDFAARTLVPCNI